MSFAWLYLGAFTPFCDRNAATSTAGELFQRNFLEALEDSSLPRPTVLAYAPVPSFPRAQLLCPSRRGRFAGHDVRTLAHVNLGALKILTLGLSAAWATLRWGWRHRGERRVVVTYNLNAPPAWMVLPVCRLMGMEMVPFVGDIYVPGEVVDDSLLRRAEFALQKRTVRSADGLIVCNRAIVDDFAPGRSHMLLEGGVRSAMVYRYFPPRPARPGFHVVFAGQLTELNGLRLLLDSLILCDAPDLRVTVLGGGPLAPLVSDFAASDPRVCFEGLVPHDRVLEVYASADLLLNLRSTEYETHRYVFPSKVVECLATGVPLLSTRTGHVEAEFGAFTFLLEDETPRGLARAISFVASLPSESRANIGRAAQEYVGRCKTWEAQVAKLADYLERKPRILAFVDFYLPGYKGGGPAISVSRRAARHKGKSEFRIFTRDRDLGSDRAYELVKAGEWNDREEALVYYARPDEVGAMGVWRTVRAVRPDVVYLNSFFSKMTRAFLILRWLGLVRAKSVVLAPRGEFSRGALSLKRRKKAAYILLAKAIGLLRGVAWQATAEPEMRDVQSVMGGVPIVVEPESAPPAAAVHSERHPKHSGRCSFVFLSRVSRMKNLEFALRSLRAVQGEVELHVYGPIEDAAYWSECEAEIAALPGNVRVLAHGPVPQNEVATILGRHDAFVLSTHGENFCHAIAEALACGLPCLISDRTPWSDLDAAGAGRVIPLERPGAWTTALQGFVDMDAEDYDACVQRVRGYYASRIGAAAGEEGAFVFPAGLKAAS